MKKLLIVLPLALLLMGCASLFAPRSKLGSGSATAKSDVRSITPEVRSMHRVTETREYVPTMASEPVAPANEGDPPLPPSYSLVREARIEETETVKTPGIDEQRYEGGVVTPTMSVVGDLETPEPPTVKLPSGASATGGTFSAVSKYLDLLPRNTGALYATLAGIGLLVIGVCLVFIAKWGNAGWPLVGLGAVLLVAGIAFETAPWIAWILAGVVSLIGLVVLWLHLRTKTGARVLVRAVEKLPADVKAVVKAAVLTEAHEERAETAVNAMVDKAKK